MLAIKIIEIIVAVYLICFILWFFLLRNKTKNLLADTKLLSLKERIKRHSDLNS